jgi:HTH-type transcriptional regulator / antitoxin HigA
MQPTTSGKALVVALGGPFRDRPGRRPSGRRRRGPPAAPEMLRLRTRPLMSSGEGRLAEAGRAGISSLKFSAMDSKMKPIRTEKDDQRAVDRIDNLVVRPDAETNEALEQLTILVMAYEAQLVPDKPMEPIEYLKASMDHRGLTQADLSRLLGSASRAAEVLSGKCELSRR